MTWFAAVITRTGDTWESTEVGLDDCESLADLAEVVRDHTGDVRLLVIEQDDEYAALVRVDAEDDEPRAFLSDGHAADAYPMAALIAEDLGEIGAPPSDELHGVDEADPEDDGDDVAGAAIDPDVDSELDTDLVAVLIPDALPSHDSAPFGDADIVDDLGTSAAELIAMCNHEGTLPIDIVVAVCERAGCAETFEAVRA